MVAPLEGAIALPLYLMTTRDDGFAAFLPLLTVRSVMMSCRRCSEKTLRTLSFTEARRQLSCILCENSGQMNSFFALKCGVIGRFSFFSMPWWPCCWLFLSGLRPRSFGCCFWFSCAAFVFVRVGRCAYLTGGCACRPNAFVWFGLPPVADCTAFRR